MVLTAIDDVDLSRKICALARERKIPVNVADVPPECDFYFGSQIRDGPLQIMISTGGAAPKLSNLIRKRIEDALPPPPFLGDAIRQVGILRTRLRKRAPGVGGSLGRKRMRWMIKICDTWTFEELADLDDEMMERLLTEGWEQNMRVPTYASLGGKLRGPGWLQSLPASTLPAIAGFTAGALVATSLHAADVVQQRGLGKPDRNALLAGVLAQRTSRSGLFSKDSKVKERDLRVFLFDCAIVLLAPKDKDKDGEAGWILFCDPIPIELLTLRAPRPTPPPSSSSPVSTSHRRSWFLDRLPASPISPPARAKTPPPFGARPGSVPSSPRRPPASSSSLPLVSPNAAQDEFQLVLSTLGKKDAAAARIWPLTLHAADAAEQRSWVQSVSTRQEEVRMRGRDGAGRGWRLVPIHLGPVSAEMGKITCYVDYDVGFHKARLWGTPQGLYEHILTAPNQETAVRKILALPGITHVLVMDFDERLMIVLVAEQTAYLAPFPGPTSMLEVSRLKKIGTNITHVAAGVLVLQPPPLPSTPPSAFVDPTPEKRERRKSATLTKPPYRAAVISGASSSKSDVTSALRVVAKEKEKEKDKESVRTASVGVHAPAAPDVAAASVAPAAAPAPAPAPAPASRPSLSPGKSKDKKGRRLSDIGIFALWRRKPEKDKASKDKKEKEKTPSSPAPTSARFSNSTVDSKPKTSIGTLKPGHGYDGPPLSKAKSATMPASLMRLPSLEFDKDESLGGNANGNGEAHGGTNDKTDATNGKAANETRQSTVGEHGETGALTDSPKPTFTQTLPSRTSGVAGAIGRGIALSRKRTTDSSSSKPAATPGPPPKIQIALDFPSIAWPSVLDANGKTGEGDRFAGSDFLADVQRDLGDLVAGGLGVSLSEEQAGMSVGEDGGVVGRSKSPVPETITEEPGKMKEPEQAVQESANEGGAAVQEPSEANPATAEQQAIPAQVTQPQIPMAQPQTTSRSAQPQHTRFLVLSKSTTLSTTVKLYTVGGLKVEDEGDIGGGRLSFYKEYYVPSQTFSIDFLRSRICFSGGDGFEIMDPTTGKLEPFLDPTEMIEPEGPLGFLINHPRRPKPSAVFRVEQKFLCCYDEFAFFLDKFGKRAREDWLVRWHGTPTSFAVQYPYLFAFEPEFTEIRHCSTGELVQLIPQSSLARLPVGEFIAPAQKQDGVPLRRVNGEVLLESEGSLYALRPMQ
ncbi:Bifunctional dehydrogenase and ferrochelatase [Ceratobasidium sp. 392]|nr:Bifunctional dehydrogenase and ferrochelatase [Ceratobasidium sp. 392]